MRVGELRDGLEYDLVIRTLNGGTYIVHTQMIQRVDDRGNHNGSYGVSVEDAVGILEKYGKLTVARDFDGVDTRTITRSQVSEVYSVRARNNGPVVAITKPKKSALGKLVERVCRFLP